MIRTGLISIAVATVCGALPVKAEDASAVRHQNLSSWQTTVKPAGGATQRLITAALPSNAKTDASTSAIAVGPMAPSKSAASRKDHPLSGIASFYWQGQKTANGETFDKTAMTAAHPSLPFNTRVKVTHVANKRSVIVRINDRGPFKTGRVIDLSHAAAGVLGMHGQGLARVQIQVVE